MRRNPFSAASCGGALDWIDISAGSSPAASSCYLITGKSSMHPESFENRGIFGRYDHKLGYISEDLVIYIFRIYVI
jgi:hypothetical protein